MKILAIAAVALTVFTPAAFAIHHGDGSDAGRMIRSILN